MTQQLRELGMIETIRCFSRITQWPNGTVWRAIVDSNGEQLTKSVRFFEDIDLCEGDLVNTLKKLQKQSHDHVMGELEY
jgi:hypothetical protein